MSIRNRNGWIDRPFSLRKYKFTMIHSIESCEHLVGRGDGRFPFREAFLLGQRLRQRQPCADEGRAIDRWGTKYVTVCKGIDRACAAIRSRLY